jgi:hypothetical protein
MGEPFANFLPNRESHPIAQSLLQQSMLSILAAL